MSSPGRSTASLDGRWELELVDVPGQRQPAPFDVLVPGSWTLQVPGAELADGTVRYRRTFTVPSSWPADGELVLHFGAVNHCAEVSVNGHDVGRHEGGWTPFELPVDRSLLVDGEQSVEVLVSYPSLLAPSASRSNTSSALRSEDVCSATWRLISSSLTPSPAGLVSLMSSVVSAAGAGKPPPAGAGKHHDWPGPWRGRSVS